MGNPPLLRALVMVSEGFRGPYVRTSYSDALGWAFSSPLFPSFPSVRSSLAHLVTKSPDRDSRSSELWSALSWTHDLELITSPFWASVSPLGSLMISDGPPKADFLSVCDLYSLLISPSLPSTT